jgi:hypothetical protein
MQIRKFFVTLFIVSVIATLSGCVRLPSPEVMKSETASYQLPKLPEPGKAIVYVVRPSLLGSIIRFNVFVDDKEASSEMGYTRGRQYIYFNLEPGDHKIYSKAENWAEFSVSANANDIIFIQQSVRPGVVMERNVLYKLEDYQGKYHVKMLKVGTIIRTDKQTN